MSQWRNFFDNPSGGKLGLLNAIQVSLAFFLTLICTCSLTVIQNIGALAGYPFAPYASDGLGRRGAIFFGSVIMVIATALQTASTSIGMFIGSR